MSKSEGRNPGPEYNESRPTLDFHIDRVVGNIPLEEKDKILFELKDKFDKQEFEKLKDVEREKTKEEVELINFINEHTNQLCKFYGVRRIEVEPKHVHVIPKDKWKSKHAGSFALMAQSITMREKDTPIEFAHNIYHELIHFKSYNAVQKRDAGKETDDYRVGVGVLDPEKERFLFGRINEAITEELTRRFIESQRHPLLERDRKNVERLRARYQDAPTKNNDGRTLFGNETYEARVIGKSESGSTQFGVTQFPYYPERQFLFRLIKQIYESHSTRFRDEEEVFQVFAKAAFTGHMLEIAHLIENTFGKGKFRELGEYTALSE